MATTRTLGTEVETGRRCRREAKAARGQNAWVTPAEAERARMGAPPHYPAPLPRERVSCLLPSPALPCVPRGRVHVTVTGVRTNRQGQRDNYTKRKKKAEVGRDAKMEKKAKEGGSLPSLAVLLLLLLAVLGVSTLPPVFLLVVV